MIADSTFRQRAQIHPNLKTRAPATNLTNSKLNAYGGNNNYPPKTPFLNHYKYLNYETGVKYKVGNSKESHRKLGISAMLLIDSMSNVTQTLPTLAAPASTC